MKKRTKKALLTLTLGLACLNPLIAFAASPDNSDKVVLNFDNVDIRDAIKSVSQLSGKNFVIDPRVSGKVNIVSQAPILKKDSYKVLEDALRMQGFATVDNGDGTISVIPEGEAKVYNMPTLGTHESPLSSSFGNGVITKVFKLNSKNFSVFNLVNALRPLVSPNNSITAIPNSNQIVVTDYASNVAKLEKTLNALTHNEVSISKQSVEVKLKYALADDVFQVLNTLSKGGSAANPVDPYGAQVNITIEPDANALIIDGPDPENVSFLVQVAKHMDEAAKASNNNLHVFYLKNADAATVQQIVNGILTGQNQVVDPSSSLFKFAQEPTSTLGSSDQTGSGSTGGMVSTGGFMGGQTLNPGSGPVSQSPQGAQNQLAGFNTGTNNPSGGRVAPRQIAWLDPQNNSIIVQAPPEVMEKIAKLISTLDQRRPQVVISAMIADVNTSMQASLGIQWFAGSANGNGGILGVGNYGPGSNSLSNIAQGVAGAVKGGSTTGAVSLPNNLMVGLVTGITTLNGITIPTLGALAQALQNKDMGNIISSPTILTLDNEEANIMVGQDVGVPTGSFAQGINGSSTPFTTYNRADVGTKLIIKPLITDGGDVQLQLFVEDSQVEAGSMSQVSGPTFDKRTMRTNFVVHDGQIIALGGMTKDSIDIVKQGVPILSDLPILGNLFSWKSREHNKTTLMVFLKVNIVQDDAGIAAMTKARLDYMQGLEGQVRASKGLLPRVDAVTITNQMPLQEATQPKSGPVFSQHANSFNPHEFSDHRN